VDENQHDDLIVSLAGGLLQKGSGLESASGGGPLDHDDVSQALELHLKDNILHGQPQAADLAKTVASEAIASAETALSKTAAGASAARLSDVEVASLEAIIEVTGRPAIRYMNGRLQSPNDMGENERWKVLVVTSRSRIEAASASVGRIRRKAEGGVQENVGTGWRIDGDLIVTNRHVARLLSTDPEAQVPDLKLDSTKDPLIEFGATDSSDDNKTVALMEIIYCAAEPFVDVAILRVAPGNGLPEPLELDWTDKALGKKIAGDNGTPATFKGRQVYVVGHPFKQRRSEAIASVFGTADGLKRWSPGFVLRLGTDAPTLEHDCSTLGGNSGSCVFSDQHKVVGIHMGGVEVDELTDRGLANLAVALARLGAHPVVKILKDATS
jgi:endonuclease G